MIVLLLPEVRVQLVWEGERGAMVAAQFSALGVCRCSMRWGRLAVMPVSGHFRAQWVVRNAGNWSKSSSEVRGAF